MGGTETSLPQLIGTESNRRGPSDYFQWRVDELRRVARIWVGPEAGKLNREPLESALRAAMKDDAAANRVLAGLSRDECQVIAAYRRYHGEVDGEVIRLDLKARRVLEVIEKRPGDTYTWPQWKQNPIKPLAQRWVLVPEHQSPHYYAWYGDRPDQPFDRYGLHAALVSKVQPAGPPSWSVAPAAGTPEGTTHRTPAEVALDISRIYAFIAARGSVKTRAIGTLSVPTIRTLEKALPLGGRSDVEVPGLHSLYFQLLRYGGALRLGKDSGAVDPSLAAPMFAKADAWQARAWARAWLWTEHWIDGIGAAEPRDVENLGRDVRRARNVLAWALGCLARLGDHWYELGTFLTALHASQGEHAVRAPSRDLAWDPQLAPPAEEKGPGMPVHRRSGPFGATGNWYANMLMGTLVELGLVERGRLRRGKEAVHAFRLTEIGRAVLGAPEVPIPAEAAERRFLVVQPNFDLLVYLDDADSASAALLGRVAESDAVSTGPVRTLRLTRESVYQGVESGLKHDQIVEFLGRHARNTLPANLVRTLSDWSSQRESLVIRSGVTLIGFGSEAERDDYLKTRGGTACGSRFALATESPEKSLKLAGALISGVFGQGRRTLELDEHGHVIPAWPVDIVQRGRFNRLALPTANGWRITRESLRRAAASGLRPVIVRYWLASHLHKSIPPLFDHAIDASMGKGPPLELGDAIVLHVPDDDLFKAIAASERFRPFLLGRLGPGWLAVRRESRKELAAALEALGFATSRDLVWPEWPGKSTKK